MLARRMASRNSGSSAASIVICVKKTMSSAGVASFCHQLEPLGAERLQLLRGALVLAACRHAQVLERHGVEVVVGQRDEAEALPPQLDDFLDDRVDGAAARLLAVGPPDRAERAVLRAAADGLHRRPHVALPAGSRSHRAGRKSSPLDSATVVQRLRRARARSRPAPSTTRRRRRRDDRVRADRGRAPRPGRAWRGCRRRRP